jgi:ERCC4-type nuclease
MKSEEKDCANAYSSVVKRVKKHNITKDNIGEIMLMQIPNVSAAAAQSIMAKYKTIPGLLHALKETPGALDEITIVTKANLIGFTETKKVRKISKTCKSNIYNYLLQEIEAEIITIDTK